MPRKSKELTLNSQEIDELSKIVSGADQEQALRARIILASAEENQNKLVAQKLGTSETNVRNWKEAYRRNGIHAITSSHGMGRPVSKNKPGNLPELVSAFIDEHPDDWTASVIAKELNVSLSDVYHTLSKLGIAPGERRRSWTYRTQEIMDNGLCHIAGVYLTPAVKILIIAEMDCVFSGHRIYGEITTKNSVLYSRLEQSAEPLSVADCIVSFSEQTSYICRGGRKSPEEFLAESAKLLSEPSIRKLDVFICSERAVNHADTSHDIAFYESDSIINWLGSFALWHERTCPDEDLLLKRVKASINGYSEACSEQMEPIIWKYAGISEKPAEFHDSPVYSSGTEEIDGKLTELAEQNNGYLGADLIFSAGDGKIVKKRIVSDIALPTAEECDFSSMEAFEKSINKLDDAMTAMSEKINAEGRETVLQTIKKNSGH